MVESEGSISYSDAMNMTETERMTYWIAIREAKGWHYDYDSGRWTEPEYMRRTTPNE